MSEANKSKTEDAPGPDVPDDLTPAPEAPPKTCLPAAPLSDIERAQRLVEAGEELEEASTARHDDKLPGERESQGQSGG